VAEYFKVNKEFKSSSFKQLFCPIYCQTLFKLAWASSVLIDLGSNSKESIASSRLFSSG